MIEDTRSERIEDVAKPPHVSIITVNFNMAEGLARTITSVAMQDFPSREYVIVDGGSSDASQSVLRDHVANITRWVSESDRGIYDAMNKGVAMAHGHWVLFLNSGDALASADVLSRVFDGEGPDDDIIFGDARVHYDDGTARLAPAADASELPFGMICSHQAVFARRALLGAAPFSIGNIRSDYEFLLDCQAANRRFRRVSVLVAEVEAGGLSDRRRIPALLERVSLLRKYRLLSGPVIRSLMFSFAWAVVAPAAKVLLPMRLVVVLRRVKMRIFGDGSARG